MRRVYNLFALSSALAVAISCQISLVQAATFTYHGNLQDAGKPAEGSYDLELTLFSAPSGGRAIGGPLTLYKVPVHGSSFSVEADFGPLTKTPSQAWLGVKVRSASSGEFAALSARSAVSADTTTSVCPGAWTLDGNAGNPVGSYLGTADTQPLTFAVNGLTSGQITQSGNSGIPDAANVVFGSSFNSIGNNNYGAAIGGGGRGGIANCGASGTQLCVNQATGDFAMIGGGFGNTASAEAATVAGGNSNTASNGGAFVGAGFGNTASGQLAVVGGGQTNTAGTVNSFIGGGYNNATSGNAAAIGGGAGNIASGLESVVGGGDLNTAIGSGAVVAGGFASTASGDGAAVGGGAGNMASGGSSAIAGGQNNVASATESVVAGGASNLATGNFSAIGGGEQNVAIGVNSTVPGGTNNRAGGDSSFAAGAYAHVRSASEIGGGNTTGDDGTFVWSDDSSTSNFASTAPDQFLARAVNGVGINTTATFPYMLTVAGAAGPITGFSPQASSEAVFENNSSAFIEMASPVADENGILFTLVGHPADGGVVYNNGGSRSLQLRTGGNVVQVAIDSSGNTFNHSGSWTMFSDARLKRDIAPIEHALDTFLGLRGQTFEYIDPDRSMAKPGRRMGFIAQDVEQVLPQWVSEDQRGYKMVTAQGFEALAVEAMRDLRAEKDAEIGMLQSRLDATQGKLDEVLARLSRLEAAQGE